MDIRERLADAYRRHAHTSEVPECAEQFALGIEIEWLEQRLRDEIEEQLESDFAMSYATKKAEERSHEAGDVDPWSLDGATPSEIVKRLHGGEG